MWLLYLVSFILGGGTLLVQMLSGMGHDAHGFEAHHPLHGPGLLSTRSVTFALFAFGLVGGALNVPGITSPGWSVVLATLAGLASGLAAGVAFQTLSSPAASGAATFEEARGQLALVLVASERGKRGKIRVVIKGQTVDMMAVADDALPAGASVRIVGFDDDVAKVVREEGRR
jgi:membrane protein implicated in regulation of membrane protease activity